jgi:hypothetical protein
MSGSGFLGRGQITDKGIFIYKMDTMQTIQYYVDKDMFTLVTGISESTLFRFLSKHPEFYKNGMVRKNKLKKNRLEMSIDLFRYFLSVYCFKAVKNQIIAGDTRDFITS